MLLAPPFVSTMMLSIKFIIIIIIIIMLMMHVLHVKFWKYDSFNNHAGQLIGIS
jgi:hypothetical protein